MMRRKKASVILGKISIFLLFMVSMTAMGSTYSTWNSNMNIDTFLSSGSMEVLFNGPVDEKYSADIVKSNGDVIKSIDADFVLDDKRKILNIMFNQGIPKNDLLDGNLIRIKFTVDKSEKSSVNRFKERKLELNKKMDTVELKAQKVILIMEGKSYYADLNDFMIPLKFDFYNEFNGQNNQNGNIYLSLTQESIDEINKLPSDLKIDRNKLNEYVGLRNQNREKNGAIVIYSCEIPYHLEQQ